MISDPDSYDAEHWHYLYMRNDPKYGLVPVTGCGLDPSNLNNVTDVVESVTCLGCVNEMLKDECIEHWRVPLIV